MMFSTLDQVHIRYQGFHPSDFAKSYVQDQFYGIHSEAPYGARMNVSLTRKDHQLKGIVTIYSSAGRFFAIATGTKLKEVVHQLEVQLRKQFDRWKTQRFSVAT